MLTKEQNDLLTKVGPGTPMGEVMRRYWVPAILSWEIEEPDCPPVTTKLLGEELIAFRDTDGKVGGHFGIPADRILRPGDVHTFSFELIGPLGYWMELARMVIGNQYQHMDLVHLEETVAAYNAAADGGKDEFGKAKMHKIAKAPFYAAIMPITVNDSYGGLRINGNAQVVDLEGNVIPGLYAGGEASGGGSQHGIGRASVEGYMAATHAVLGQES